MRKGMEQAVGKWLKEEAGGWKTAASLKGEWWTSKSTGHWTEGVAKGENRWRTQPEQTHVMTSDFSARGKKSFLASHRLLDVEVPRWGQEEEDNDVLGWREFSELGKVEDISQVISEIEVSGEILTSLRSNEHRSHLALWWLEDDETQGRNCVKVLVIR